MIERIIDLSEAPAYLRVERQQLRIDRKDADSAQVPLSEVGVLILAHRQVTCTASVLSGLMSQGSAVIACNERNLPTGLMLPTDAHFAQAERFIAQASITVPLKKRLWKQIVIAKIKAQAGLLQSLYDDDRGLKTLVGRIRSGDPSNLEAQASRRYWPALFDDDSFRRRRELEDQNRLLNYGYAILRAMLGRAICAAGLHPSLGVHHHNRYNAFCLADDLMEPYRPLIDSAVVEHVRSYGPDAPLDRTAKTALLETATNRYPSEGEMRTLFDLATRTASSLVKVFLKEEQSVFFPEFC
jgi:CRISPR-associated protein Cas1